jgi:hypothetical protein
MVRQLDQALSGPDVGFRNLLTRANMISWRTCVVIIVVLICGCGDPLGSSMTNDATAKESEPQKPPVETRVFISGHSLTDNPLPDYMAAIAQSLGTPMYWNQQNMFGSSIMERTIWSDTVRYLRHFHDRFIEANPQGTTYLYHSWTTPGDKNNPTRWIGYEREASKLWQCVATRINVSLAAEGRGDRIASLPAATALAALVERATQSPGLAGVSASSVRETMDRLLEDNIHLTRLGVYYVALVGYSTVYRRSPMGGWAPPEITKETASSLQEVAWNFVRGYIGHEQPLTLRACRQFLREGFNRKYWSYMRDMRMYGDGNALWIYAKWVQHTLNWHYRFWRDDEGNPLHYDASTDSSYWYPRP